MKASYAQMLTIKAKNKIKLENNVKKSLKSVFNEIEKLANKGCNSYTSVDLTLEQTLYLKAKGYILKFDRNYVNYTITW